MAVNKGHSTDFGRGSVAGHVIRQALPLMLSSFVQLLYNIVDRIYIGHIPGEGQDALTGLGLTFPIVSVILAFTMLFGQGGAPVFSIAMGSGNEKKAGKVWMVQQNGKRYYFTHASYITKGVSFHTGTWWASGKKRGSVVKNGKPGTYGCIRMYTDGAKYIFANTTLNRTGVIVTRFD